MAEPRARREQAPLSVLVVLTLMMVALTGHMTRTVVPLPALEALSPFEAAVSHVRERRTPGRQSYAYLELRFQGIGASFQLNAGDRLGDDSTEYRALREILHPGARVTAWARRMPPRADADLSDRASLTDHRLPGTGDGIAGLGTWSAGEDGGLFEVVQLDAGGRRILPFAAIQRGVERERYWMLALWLMTAGMVAYTAFAVLGWWRRRRMARSGGA